jgi:3-carboxy-cis,cis-muconate cycloisomerase
MAHFEAALAQACADCGVIAPADAPAIAQVCERAKFDVAALAREPRHAATLAIPFLKALTQQARSRRRNSTRFSSRVAASEPRAK